MTATEIDLSHVGQARDIHVAFSAALGFPEWYGHNWNAFWDLVSSDYPLPDRMTICRNEFSPAEATKMLACFADNNNSSGRVCELAVTDDYASPMFLLRYEATPVAPLEDVEGAFVNCWIKAAPMRPTRSPSSSSRTKAGESATEDTRPLVAQACVDGCTRFPHVAVRGR